jgi:hypothetical protein
MPYFVFITVFAKNRIKTFLPNKQAAIIKTICHDNILLIYLFAVDAISEGKWER